MYSSEINFTLKTFWDAGYTIEFTEYANGVSSTVDDIDNFEQAISELIEMAIDYYPESDFAKKYNRFYLNKGEED